MEQWRPNKQMSFLKWRDCTRCGLPWPEQALQKQRGVLVCPECLDEPSAEDIRAERTRVESSDKRVWMAD